MRDAGRARRGRRPPLLPEPGLPGPARPGVRPLRGAGRDGHRGRRLGGPLRSSSSGAWSTAAPTSSPSPSSCSRRSTGSRAQERRKPARGDPEGTHRPAAGEGPQQLGIPQVGESTAVDLALARGARAARTRSRPRDRRPSRNRGSPPWRPSCGGWPPRDPKRSRRSRGSGPSVSAAMQAWFTVPATSDALRELVGRRRRPGAPRSCASPRAGARETRGSTGRPDGRRDRHDRGLQPRGGRGTPCARRAASPPGRCRRRTDSWSRPRSRLQAGEAAEAGRSRAGRGRLPAAAGRRAGGRTGGRPGRRGGGRPGRQRSGRRRVVNRRGGSPSGYGWPWISSGCSARASSSRTSRSTARAP